MRERDNFAVAKYYIQHLYFTIMEPQPHIEHILTADGSSSFFSNDYNESYHSTNGAISESNHIFIKNGLYHHSFRDNQRVTIFEQGFGTGLNTILTIKEAIENNITIDYFSVEKHPLDIQMINNLNYIDSFDKEFKSLFFDIHKCEWNKRIEILPNFSLTKIEDDIEDLLDENRLQNIFNISSIDVTYYDAFSPERQPQLWSKKIFSHIFKITSDGGILTTYSSKGVVKQALRDSGFIVKRVKGPIGKRHIVIAQKIIS